MKEGRTEWRTGIAGLEHIKDSRAEFIENLLKAFERDHPEFIEHLKVSTSIPTVNMWWAHTIKPRNPIDIMAQTIPMYPNGSFFPE